MKFTYILIIITKCYFGCKIAVHVTTDVGATKKHNTSNLWEKKKMRKGDLSQSLQSLNAQFKNLCDEYKKKERKLGINWHQHNLNILMYILKTLSSLNHVYLIV